MSFKLSWGGFDDKFYQDLKSSLNVTLNSGPPIPNITDKLLVYQIHLGDIAPELQLLEVDPSIDRVKFVFKIKYNGNGLLELRTMVQANPIYLGATVSKVSKVERDLIKKLRFGSASNPHVIPLSIMIKDIEFDGILSVCIINSSGGIPSETVGGAGSAGGNSVGGGKIEASFKEDPLKKINIVTSFDEFPAAAKFIATLVENQLRDFIMKEFPTIVGSITIPIPTQQPSTELVIASNNSSSNSSNNNTVDSSSNNSSPPLSPQLSDGGHSSVNSSANSSPSLSSNNITHNASLQLSLQEPSINSNNNTDNLFLNEKPISKKMGYIN